MSSENGREGGASGRHSRREPPGCTGLRIRQNVIVTCWRGVAELADATGRSLDGTAGGHRSNFLTVAAPQLARRGLPATVLLNVERVRTDDAVASDQRWTGRDDNRLLSWSEAKSLECAQGVELGLYGDRPHVLTTSLASLPADETERELRALATLMADQLSQSPVALDARKVAGVRAGERADPVPIAFPKGGHPATLVEQARRLGFSCAVTWDSPWRTADGDGFNLPSVEAGETSDNIAVFAARLSGLFDRLRRAKEALRLRDLWSAVEKFSGWARAIRSAPTGPETRGGGAAGPPGGP